MVTTRQDSWWRYAIVAALMLVELLASGLGFPTLFGELLGTTPSDNLAEQAATAGLQPLFGSTIWAMIIHSISGLVGLAAMRWRRTHPVAICVAVSMLAIAFPVTLSCAFWAYLSVCTHRNVRWSVLCGVLLYATSSLEGTLGYGSYLVPTQADASWIWGWLAPYGSNLLMVLLLAVLGTSVGARREADQERAAALELERELRMEAARAEERVMLAREMHDVLAHKMSLVAMHAAALAHREDLDGRQQQAVAQTIATSSRQALAELRMILGGLRQTGADGQVLPPQPSLIDLDELLAEYRMAGRRIETRIELAGEPSTTVSRHAYRIIQECLTNAARHAPGLAVNLSLIGSQDQGVEIVVTNPCPLVQPPSLGSGLGLIGLQERVQLVDGRMKVSPGPNRFVVEVWLPW